LSLGFGDKACIDCFEEDKAFVPEPSWKMNKHNFGWFKGDTVNMGVGQGYLVSTPIQLAKYAYIMANKGKFSDLSLKKDLVKSEKSIEFNKFSNDDWFKLHESMVNVIEGNTGTARRLREKKNYIVAAKTGTAELVSGDNREQYSETRLDDSLRDHALIIAFGPMPNPRYAVSVVVENGESGGSVAGPVAISVLNSLIQE
jgi:penicillin-binding protein 2